MKMKRIMGLIMAVALAAGMTAGCKQQDDEKNKEKEDGEVFAKGRYVEKEIMLPEGAGEATGIQDKDGALVLYARSDNGYHSYTYQNEEWIDSGDAAWMTDARDRLGLLINYIYMGRDGNVYGMALPSGEGIPYGQHILRDAGDGSAVDCTPEPCLQLDEEGRTELFVDMAVLKNGAVGIAEMSGIVNFYQDNKKIAEAEVTPIVSDHQSVMGVSDESVAVFGKDRQSVDFYNADSFEKESSVAIKQSLEGTMITPGESGIWYVVNADGIQRITENGSIVEIIMDGTGALMSTGSAYLVNFICGKNEVLYGLYTTAGGEKRLMCYQFDENAGAVRDESLSIYGLKENQTVSQAVYVFQSRYPDVKVEYHAAAAEEETPASDTIRSLNAELLNGSGADVLILDGLPTESYMEKGVLADLSDLAERLSGQGVLADVIGNTAVMDEKIYAIPARVSVPVIFGDETQIKACQDPDSLHAYLEQNPGERLFRSTTHEMAGMTLFHTFYQDLKNEKGGLDEEKLAQFLSDWLALCEIQATRTIEEKTGMESGIWEQMRSRFNSGFGMINDQVVIDEMNGLISSMVPYAMARENGRMIESLKQYYVPQVIAGVNASSKNQELAEEFIECLFDESVQKGDNADGFPVLKSALDYQAEYVETPEALDMSVGTGSEDPETGESVNFSASYPSREEVEQLIRLIEGLKEPFMPDNMITDTVLEEMDNCYNGKQTAEETAKAICQKIDTYLAE